MVWLMVCLQPILAYAALPAPVADALRVAGIPQEHVAVYVQPVDVATPVLSLNADKSFNPASIMKLVTTYVALEKLGPAFRWKTEVYRDGEVHQGVLHGNLIVKGYGDPNFQAHDFWRLLMRLQQLGIRSIQGNLIIDKTYFSPKENHIPFDDEVWRAYNAKPSAFLVGGRKTSLQFDVVAGQVQVTQEFALPEVNVQSALSLREGECGDWRNYINYVVVPQKNNVDVVLKGTYSAKCESRYLELSLFIDEQYAFYTFKKLWSELGGKFNGKLSVTALPAQSTKIMEQLSLPLGEAIRDINKWSNNLMARQLLLTMAASEHPKLANEAHGAEVIQQTLKQLGLPSDGLVLENGSGLSRIERINAAQLAHMLLHAYQRPIMPEFIASLPILGLDGTVKTRMQDASAQAQVHLKTGSINGVSAVAGYVLDKQQRRHVVVMIVNDAKAAQARKAQDALIEWVYQH
jgi:D-alanyl-D-alanine carboxypeptidase/D-alanyl-D-alanine-endopeptidase (penicillin-binding protein 4)